MSVQATYPVFLLWLLLSVSFCLSSGVQVGQPVLWGRERSPDIQQIDQRLQRLWKQRVQWQQRQQEWQQWELCHRWLRVPSCDWDWHQHWRQHPQRWRPGSDHPAWQQGIQHSTCMEHTSANSHTSYNYTTLKCLMWFAGFVPIRAEEDTRWSPTQQTGRPSAGTHLSATPRTSSLSLLPERAPPPRLHLLLLQIEPYPPQVYLYSMCLRQGQLFPKVHTV